MEYPTTQFALTEGQRSTLINSLHVAGIHFQENAISLRNGLPQGHYAMLADQFDMQAAETLELAARLESAEFINVGPVVE